MERGADIFLMNIQIKHLLPESQVILIATVVYIPFLFLGYGSDMDTYNVLQVGTHFAKTLDYVPSRGPGFFVFETLEYFFNLAGGSLLTNLSVMIMSLVTLYGFMRLCRQFNIPHARLLGLLLAVHPYHWVNSTCTMDYLFAIGFVFLGIIQVMRGRYFTAGAAMALGIGSRLTAAVTAGGFLAWYFLISPEERKKLLVTGITAAIFSIIFYLPPASFTEWTTRFMTPTVGGQEFWTPYLRVGRFVYKNIYFWGPAAALILSWGFTLGILRKHFLPHPENRGLPILAILVIAAYELFYFGIPTEPAYLLPTVPFWLILMGSTFKEKRLPLYLLLGGLLAANCISINVARPNIENRATDAIYGLWIEPGHLVKDTGIRLEYIRCGYQPCEIAADGK